MIQQVLARQDAKIPPNYEDGEYNVIGLDPHSEHRFPAPSPSLSGTFLQTLPHLVTPLKGYSLSPRSCPATRSAPSERFGY